MDKRGNSARTRMFARVLGPYFTIVPAAIAVRGDYMRTLLVEFQANPIWPWLFGTLLLILGLIIIAFHQYWRGAAAIIVSGLGWFMAIRGVLLLAVPQSFNDAANALTGPLTYTMVRLFFVGLALLGAYLTYVGWRKAGEADSAGPKQPTVGA